MFQSIEDEQRVKKLHLQDQMIDDRIIETNEFLSDENFIKIEEFKSFLFKIKQNKLSLQMKLCDFGEVVTGLVQKLQEYDLAS